MGRQSHLTRLALGRSPFDPPLLDESGEFIIGPNVNHDTARDYTQDFDSRGHPRNIASQISRRRLLRAQNEALSTVGVVVRKAKANRTPWQTMSNEDKFKLVVQENTTGAYLGIIESIVQKLSTLWISNLRRRVVTYKAYLGLPLPEKMLSEWSAVGPRAFLFAGIIPSAISRISRYLRTAIVEEIPLPKRPARHSGVYKRYQIANKLRHASFQLFWFALEYPFYAYSVLQALYLLPPGFRPSLLTLIPFKDISSQISNPAGSSEQSWSSMVLNVMNGMRDPFVLALVRDRLSSILFPKLYVWIRELLVKPNRPDEVSLQSASAVSAGLHITPGQFTAGAARRLVPGEIPPETARGLLKRWFSNVVWFSLTILHTQRVPMAIELSPEIESQLIKRSTVHYNSLTRQDRNSGITRAPRTLRVMAIRAAFHEFNLDPDHSMVDIFELADEMSLSGSSGASTSTPEPQEHHEPQALPPPGETTIVLDTLDTNISPPWGDNPFSIQEEEENLEIPVVVDGVQDPLPISEEVVLEIPGSVAVTQDAPVSSSLDDSTDFPSLTSEETSTGLQLPRDPGFEEQASQPAILLEPLLEPAHIATEQMLLLRPASPSPEPSPVFRPASPAQDQPEPILIASRPTTPPSPVPGISRAASLPHTTPRPLRRPTVSEQRVPYIEDGLSRWGQVDIDSISLPDTNKEVYRVSILSNHAAEAIAYHATSLLESLILLPFDAMFARSLARNFLARQPSSVSQQIASTTGSMGDVWSLGMRAQMMDLTVPQELQFWGNFLITMGMQGLTNFAIWVVGTRITLGLGERFGWGKI